MQADAAGLEGGDLVVLGHHAEGDQHGHQHGDRRRVVEELGRQEEQVGEHLRQRDLVTDHVAQQLEEGVDVGHQHEAPEQHEEVEQEGRQDIGIQDLRQQRYAAPPAAVARHGRRLQVAANPAPQRLESRVERGDEVAVAGPLEARHQHEAEDREQRVGGPHGRSHRNRALARQADQADEAHVVEEGQEYGDDHGGGLAGLARADAQRNPHQGEQHAAEGERQPLVQFDGGIPGVARFPVQRPGIHLAVGARGLLLVGPGGLQRLVARRSAGDDVLVLDARLVRAAIEHVKLDAVVLQIRHGDGFARQGDGRDAAGGLGGLSRGRRLGLFHVRQKQVAPLLDRAGDDVSHVQHDVGKLLLEDARLDLGGQFLGLQPVEYPVSLANGPGGEPQRAGRGGHQRQRREGQNGKNDPAAGNAGGAHADDLAVAGHAAQPDQDAHQRAHGQREDQRGGQQQR